MEIVHRRRWGRKREFTKSNRAINNVGKRRDVFEWYAKSSIFVLSSQKEGFPNVLLEAMGSGCISFDCPSEMAF